MNISSNHIGVAALSLFALMGIGCGGSYSGGAPRTQSTATLEQMKRCDRAFDARLTVSGGTTLPTGSGLTCRASGGNKLYTMRCTEDRLYLPDVCLSELYCATDDEIIGDGTLSFTVKFTPQGVPVYSEFWFDRGLSITAVTCEKKVH